MSSTVDPVVPAGMSGGTTATASLGLSTAEADRRLAQVGPNRHAPEHQESVWEELFESLREPLVLLLIVVAILYAILGELRDAFIIFGVIITVAVVETWTEWRAGNAIAALSKLAAPQAHVWRDGVLSTLPPEALVPGDVIALTAGTRVPADARLVQADELAADESLVTGESAPVEHRTDDPATALLLAGSLIVRGRGTAEVTATGAQSTLGRIATLVGSEPSPRTPLQLHMAELARTLVLVALAVSIIVPLLGVLGGQPARQMLLTGLTLAFATIPEELPVLIVIVLGLGSLGLARKGAIVRRLVAAETLGATTVVCTDKTGTLTENRITLTTLQSANEVMSAQEPSAGDDRRTLLRCARLASEPPEGAVSTMVDPIDAAVWSGSAGHTEPVVQRFPFDTERRLASATTVRSGQTFTAVKGAPEAVIACSISWRSADGARPLRDAERTTLLAAAAAMAADGGRVLAVASRESQELPLDRDIAERDLVVEGLLVFRDPLRPEVPAAIAEMQSAGVSVSIVTGDQATTAAAIARQAGLHLPVFSGAEIAAWGDDVLATRAKAGAIFARTQPAEKLRIVQALTAAGEVVAVTGDGVNDAPALRAAAIGVAMGRGGSDVAREAADLVITDDNFATLVHATAEGRRLYENLRKAVRYYLAIKVALILLSLGAALARLPLPFAPLQIVILELFMDLGASLAFVNQPAEDDLMHRPPRQPGARFLDPTMITGIGVGGITLTLISGGAFLYGLASLPLESARTLALVTWLVGHTALGVVMAWERRHVSVRGLLANPALVVWTCAAWLFAAALVVVAPVRDALHAGPVPLATVASAAVLAALLPLWIEIGRWLRFRWIVG